MRQLFFILLVCVSVFLMAFMPSPDVVGKYESICIQKWHDPLTNYADFRKVDLRADTTFLMQSAKEAYYGKWQIKGEFLILAEMVPEDIPLCVSSGNRLRQWYYWIKDRNMLIRFIGQRQLVPVDTLVRISDERYYEASPWGDGL